MDAGKVSEVFAMIASKGGAKFVGGCGVKKVLTKDSGNTFSNLSTTNNSSKNFKVTGVETEK